MGKCIVDIVIKIKFSFQKYSQVFDRVSTVYSMLTKFILIDLNQMCSTIGRTLNDKTTKDTHIKLYKAVAVPTLTYGSEI
jgi:hypothetical protein